MSAMGNAQWSCTCFVIDGLSDPDLITHYSDSLRQEIREFSRSFLSRKSAVEKRPPVK